MSLPFANAMMPVMMIKPRAKSFITNNITCARDASDTLQQFIAIKNAVQVFKMNKSIDDGLLTITK